MMMMMCVCVCVCVCVAPMLTQGRAKLIEEVCMSLSAHSKSSLVDHLHLLLTSGDIISAKFRNNDFMPQLATVGSERH